jgi:hypothetical protein
MSIKELPKYQHFAIYSRQDEEYQLQLEEFRRVLSSNNLLCNIIRFRQTGDEEVD